MTKPTTANITFVRGNNYVAKFTFTGRDLTIGGTELIYRSVAKPGASDPFLRKTLGAGISVPGVDDNKTDAYISFTRVETRAHARGKTYTYEFELRQNGAETSVFAGTVIGTLGDNDDAP